MTIFDTYKNILLTKQLMHKKAFSFVEILVTITIIALLTIIGLTANQSYKDKSHNSNTLANIETIKNALESYSGENSNLPLP
jgi:prepilin-type N-terminal cleavage/methylation domain-containing protein